MLCPSFPQSFGGNLERMRWTGFPPETWENDHSENDSLISNGPAGNFQTASWARIVLAFSADLAMHSKHNLWSCKG